MRISDWSSDLCSSDLTEGVKAAGAGIAPVVGVEQDAQQRQFRAKFDRGGVREFARQFPSLLRRKLEVVPEPQDDRTSVVWRKRVSVRVGVGGRLIVTKNTTAAITAYMASQSSK